jgi:murein DD-endopeptidase MepM/ murein hydrolase activator NlpD
LAALSTLPVEGDISSTYGARSLSRKKKSSRMHSGVDITAPRGTPVLAAASGVVFFAGRWAAYGKIVEIDHGNGLITRYAHLDTKNVETGARVASGESIGTVGRSGRTTGAHLHFETLVNGRTVDPMKAEMWQQTPAQLAAKRGTYVSGLRFSAKPAH